MENRFTPYKESFELKELGFDEPCFAYYDEEDNGANLYEYANCNGNVTGDKACYNYDFLSVTNSQLEKYGAFCDKDEEGLESYSRWTAPSYQEAFEFFRDKFKLNCWIENYYDERFYPKIDEMVHPKTIDRDKLIFFEEFDSYEKAKLACLRKLIEIVKNKNNEQNPNQG